MRELSVVGVRVELPSNQPIVLLREVEGDRYLPIWIGAVEATAIAYEQKCTNREYKKVRDRKRSRLLWKGERKFPDQNDEGIHK